MANTSDTISVSLVIESDLLEKADKRARELDLNRSQYFRRLARRDLDQARLAKKQLKEAA